MQFSLQLSPSRTWWDLERPKQVRFLGKKYGPPSGFIDFISKQSSQVDLSGIVDGVMGPLISYEPVSNSTSYPGSSTGHHEPRHPTDTRTKSSFASTSMYFISSVRNPILTHSDLTSYPQYHHHLCQLVLRRHECLRCRIQFHILTLPQLHQHINCPFRSELLRRIHCLENQVHWLRLVMLVFGSPRMFGHLPSDMLMEVWLPYAFQILRISPSSCFWLKTCFPPMLSTPP